MSAGIKPLSSSKAFLDVVTYLLAGVCCLKAMPATALTATNLNSLNKEVGQCHS